MMMMQVVDQFVRRRCKWLSKFSIFVALCILCLVITTLTFKTNRSSDINSDSSIDTNDITNDIQCDDINYPSKSINSLTELLICNKTTNTIMIAQEDFIFNCTYLDDTKQDTIANITFHNQDKRLNVIENIIRNTTNFHAYDDNTVLITIVNRGLIYLFFNWICSIEKNLGTRALAKIKKSILIIAADREVGQILLDHNFNTIQISTIVPGVKISSKHPRGFGDNKIHTLKLAVYILVYDILQLSYNVFWFDSDIVWFKDPIKYFHNHNRKTDLYLTSDGRYKMTHALDMEGPYNAGVAYIRSNCRTIIAFETMIQNSGIIKMHYTPITDQGILNIVVKHSPLFKNLKVTQLPWNLFINGNIFHKTDKEQDLDKLDLNEIIMLHASWTDGYQDKIKKFNAFDAYYYNRTSRCSYFNETYLFFDYMNT